MTRLGGLAAGEFYADAVLPKTTIERHLARLQKVCGQLPEAEVKSAAHHTFLVRGKKFAYYLIDHHGDGRVSMQFKAERGLNQSLVDTDPSKFFLPPYMAHHGWIGLYIDRGKIDWGEIEDFLVNAYRLAAPKSLARIASATWTT